MKNKITLLNMLSTLVLQVITIISGFVIPKLILVYFGSEVNGLVSSLTQFLSYIALVEGGITGVVMANLYKPLTKNDNTKISSIINTTRNFYKKIGFIFIGYSVLIAVLYPIIFDTSFNYLYIFLLTIILSINLFIQYMFSLTYRTLLNADKKIYIVSLTQCLIVLMSIIFAIISVKVYPQIHIFKLISGLLYIIQPIVYSYFVKKYYKLDKDAVVDNSLLKSRWDGFAINVAAFIHNGTDITLLTIFSTLSNVSVYSVYSLVSTGLKSIINSITSGLNPMLGMAYAKGDFEDLNNKMDSYEYIIFILVFLLFSVGALLITPFVSIYTKNITDVNYYQPMFGYMILIAEALYLVKFPHLNLAYSSNKFKEITKPAYIEALINIIISIILVPKFGLIGVAFGTIIAMLYRLIFHVWYTKKIIPNRSMIIFYRKFIIFIIATFVGFLFCYFIPISNITFINLILYGIIYGIIFLVIYLLVSLLFFKNEIKFFNKYLFRGSNIK